ncbi:MAG TPA: molybdate ABC transporter permease subunit [Bryobacteraceae bacterium]|nr:molybdate ABC transporter permease subunit [Bryobacteraceae bacterium]
MTANWFPLWLSLRVAVLATLVSVAFGLWMAWVLANREFRGKELVYALVTLPLVLPPTVLGYYLLVVLGTSSPLGHLYESLFGAPLVFTWQAAVVASTLHAIPLLTKSARAAFETTGRNYEKAARAIGASDWRVFWRVTLPLSRRAVAAASLTAFARALGDFGVTLMIAGNLPGKTQTAAVGIYDAIQRGDTRAARVLVLALSVATLAIVYAANRLGPRPVAE